MKETLGRRISALRHEKALKQDELAEKLGVSPQAVSKWENDQTCPDISLLADLAKILGVSIDELLTGKKEESTVKILPKNEIKEIKDMMLRITITSKSGDTTRINLPLGIIELAINSGLNISQVSGCDSLKSLNLSAIMESIRHGAIGTLMEIETADGETVKIFVE